MVKVLFAAKPEKWGVYEEPLTKALREAGIDADLRPDHKASEVDYIVYAPNSGLDDFRPFTRCKAVLNLWAGVEDIAPNPTLTQPLARMVDEGLTEGMVEWVTGHVLRHHLGIDGHILRQDGVWRHDAPPLARSRVVTMLGLGALGTACASMLVRLGFRVRGWARSEKRIDGVTCFSGESGLRGALDGADIAVLLLPLTGATTNLMNAERIGWMAPGAVILNPGRGPLIDDDALLTALDAGQLSHATLDVFRTEPLPPDHRFWAHPQVTVTPHIASQTRPESASRTIAENVRRGEAGLPFLHLVDRGAGY